MIRAVAALALSLAVAATGCGNGDGDDEVVVFAASSLTDVLEAVDRDTDLSIEPVVAGSTTLVAQLREGAEADVLVTADRAAMDLAGAEGSVAGTPVVVATNSLVLAVAPGNPAGIDGLADLGDTGLTVGLCAPEVPCGALARSATAELGVTVAVDTEEPNVRALAAKVRLGEVDAGLVYRTDAIALDLDTVAAAGLDDHVTEYLAATVDTDPTDAARRVVDALRDDPAIRATFETAGFGPAPAS